MSINSFENYPMSWKPSLRLDDKPLYIELAEQLEQDIANGILRPGTKLPPQRELADFLDINVSTVSRAFKLCAQKGLLSGTVGCGTFVAYDVATNIFSLPDAEQPHVIQLGSMTPETIVQDEATKLLQKMMTEPDFGALFQYTHATPKWHQEAAAGLFRRIGCQVTSDNILAASGGQNAISCIFAGLFRPGDRIGTDPLVYPGLKSAAKLFGIQLVPIAQENGEMSADGIRYAVKNDNIKAIYVMPDQQNPTTHTMSAGCRKRIADVAKELDLLLIEDGINSLLANKPDDAIAAAAPDHTIFIFSLSKTILPALRLSYLAVPPRWKKQLENALYNINLSQSALLTELAARLIASGQLEPLLERRRKGLALRNEITDRILHGFRVRGDCQSLSRWLLLPDGMSGEEFERISLEHGVFVYGSERFAVGKDRPIGAARLAICAPGSLEELEQGLTILKSLLG